MTPERLLIHFKMSPAIGLLQARNAPLVVSFLHQQFKQSRIIAILHSDHGCVDKVVGDWCVGRLAGGDQVIAPVAQGVIPVRELQLLIRNHETEAAAKRANFVRLSQALRDAEIDEPPTDFATFEALQSRLAPLRKQLQADVLACERQHTALIESRVEPVRSQRDAEAELQVLMQRQGNLPPEYVELRRRMCDELGLSERDLPFAAELIAVKLDQRDWEGSTEMVLSGFSLSLLMDESTLIRHRSLAVLGTGRQPPTPLHLTTAELAAFDLCRGIGFQPVVFIEESQAGSLCHDLTGAFNNELPIL